MWQGRAILLMDLDAFFASVEQLDHPEWRGKAVIVGGDPEKRGVVSTCSYEARTFGVHSAMPSWQAAKLCPNAIWTHGNMPRYAEMSNAVMEVLYAKTPKVQQVSIDEAFADISPGRYIAEDPILICQEIMSGVAKLGITCSIGLGVNKSVAKIACTQNKPNGLTVVFPGQEAGFLATLPIRDLSGVGKQSEKRLHDLDINTLGDLAHANEGTLKPIFGKNWQMMKERADGSELSPVSTEREIKSVSHEQTFAKDLTAVSDIRRCADILTTKVARRARKYGLSGNTITLKLKFNDFSFITTQTTLGFPTQNEFVISSYIGELLSEVFHEGMSVRLVGVALSGFDADNSQLSFFGTEDCVDADATLKLAKTTDAVIERFGKDAIHYGRELHQSLDITNTIAGSQTN